MKKILSLVALATALLFNGCSSGPSVDGAPENVKTYLIGQYEDVATVESKLKAAGFDIVATVAIGKKKVPNVIFTNAHIKSLANRPMRGLLAGEMRIFVNEARKEIRVNNPLYFFKAFLQDEYKPGDEKPVIDALMTAFPSLTDTVMSKDSEGNDVDSNVDFYAYDGLAGYHYMIGMPYYHEQNVVGEAATVAELVATLTKKAKKNLLYTIELAPNRIVCGVRMGKRTSKYPKKIGDYKAGLMPWQILIEEKVVDGKTVAQATTLDAKYRIALSYPLLSMVGEGSFAGIMTVPGAVEKDMKKYFK